MEKFNYLKETPLWILLIAPFIYVAYVWNALPDSIPIHFDIKGEANGWGSKHTIFGLPAINAGIYLLLLYIRKIDPKRMNDELSASIFYKLRVVLTIFITLLCIATTYATVQGDMKHGLTKFIIVAVFLMLSFIGNLMINIKPNWFIGIRTPWTLSNDNVWRKTHQVVGRLWFFGGIICAALSMLLPDNLIVSLILTFALGSTGFAFGYSYWLFKKEATEAE